MGSTSAGPACAPEQAFCFSRLQSIAGPRRAGGHARQAPRSGGARRGDPGEWEGMPGRLWVGSGLGAWRASGSGPSVFNSPVCRRGPGKGQAVRA